MLMVIVSICAGLSATFVPLPARATLGTGAVVECPPDECGVSLSALPCWALPGCPMSLCGSRVPLASVAGVPGRCEPVRGSASPWTGAPIETRPELRADIQCWPDVKTAFLVSPVPRCRDALSSEEPPLD